jgi:signal transduction histidine kinase/PAS domain-containing protein/ActR/RegA family two-component response regulator
MALFRPSRDLSSLRFRLPVLLMLYCSAVALVLYVVADRVQETRFEQDFESLQLLRATEVQSRTERAAERSELETAQREFSELGVFEELRAGVFVTRENVVALSSRREWAGRPLDLASFDLPADEQTRVAEAMREARRTGRAVSRFAVDRDRLAIVMPAALPFAPGDLRLDRRALILLVYDLSFAKSVNSYRLRQQFAVAMIGVLVAVFGLGVTLHFFVTRRIEHLHGTMARFAAGEPIEKEPTPDSKGADEISHLFRHFTAIAATSNRINRSLRTISNCNQVLVHATDESSLLHQICEVIVRDGGYRLAWVTLSDSAEAGTARPVAYAGPWSESAAQEARPALALPLESEGRVLGVLTIQSGEGAAFDTAEQSLLRELADDLAFGIQALRTAINRRQAQQALHDSQSKLVMATDLAGLAPWELDAKTNTFILDERIYTQLGTTAEREGGIVMDADEYVRRFIPREDHHILQDFVAKANAATEPGYTAQFEHRVRRVDGTIGVIQVRASYLKDANGRLLKVYGANQDITERKRAAAEVVAANERYARQEASLTTLMRGYVSAPDDFTPIVREITEVVARTLEVAQVGVWRHDDRGTATRCQDLFEWPEMRHSSGQELTEEACPAFFRSIAESDVIAAYDAAADTRTSELGEHYLAPHGITSMMSVAIRSQGSTVGVLSCTHKGPRRRWMPDEQTYALAVANLLSAIIAQVERRRLELQLRQAQKLEAIGQLAGGVAHDFNNILTVILGRTEEAAHDQRLPADLKEAIADISQNAERATALTRQLLAFSRRQTIQVRDIDMNVVVGNLTRMLNRILGEDVVVEFHYAPRPAHVRADPGMIEQVLLNLVVNARDAMPLGGHLSIEISMIEGASEPGRPVRPMGSWVCLRVTDTGSGIPAEHLPHIFEPFFTTKDVGKGTGLGLATTYGIVQQHGGWVEVDSEVDRGTTFRVFFPHVSAAAPEPPAPSAAPRPPRGDETILVVEDEDGVRALVIKVLEDLGYRLLQAQSGPRAIEIWREHGPAIDLLITDIVMPDGMNGIELADRLRRTRPSLKVIFTSGYLADVSRDDIPARETDAYLAKPFSLPELARLVRRTLDAREPTSGREGSR